MVVWKDEMMGRQLAGNLVVYLDSSLVALMEV